MKSSIKTALAAVALIAAVGPASAQSAYSQLAASAGLSPSEAAGLTLGQIAAYHVNRDKSLPGPPGDPRPDPERRLPPPRPATS